MDAFNSLLENKTEILKDYKTIIQTLTDTSKLDKESIKLQSEIDVIIELLNKCVEENAHSALDQAEYEKKYTPLAESYESIKNRLEEIKDNRLEQRAKHERILAYIKELEKRDRLVENFDEELWNGTIEKIMVHSEERITFIFKDDMELNCNI